MPFQIQNPLSHSCFVDQLDDIQPEISEKDCSTLETRISHIQSCTSRREFLSPNLMLRDNTENNFLQSQASRRDRDLFFLISDYETRTRSVPREKINLILTRTFEIDNYRYALLWFFTGVVFMRQINRKMQVENITKNVRFESALLTFTFFCWCSINCLRENVVQHHI